MSIPIEDLGREADHHVHHLFHETDKTVFLTDLDGCLFDWLGDFCRHLESDHAWTDPGKPRSLHHALDAQLHLPRQTIVDIIADYQGSEKAGALTVYPDALEWLPKIAEIGYTFVGITTAGTEDAIVANRVKNLETHFDGLFSGLYVLPPLVSKASVLKDLPRAFWVDDTPKHIRSGIEAGHESLWMHRLEVHQDYDNPDLTPYRDWGEIFKMVAATHATVGE